MKLRSTEARDAFVKRCPGLSLCPASAWPQLETTSLFIGGESLTTSSLCSAILPVSISRLGLWDSQLGSRWERRVSSFKALCSAGPRINLRLIGRMTGAGSNGMLLDRRDFVWEIIGRINPVMDHIQMHLRPPPRGFILIPQPDPQDSWLVLPSLIPASSYRSDGNQSSRKPQTPQGRNQRETQPGKRNKSPD